VEVLQVSTAITLKRLNPDLSIAIIRREEKVLVPCAIPYLFHSINSIDKNVISGTPLVKLSIDIYIDEVVSADLENKVVRTSKGLKLGFKTSSCYRFYI
jgi:NADPH-dependent 2,4-dienoyl-CoA reductase/sulfur reductase-like enzyme